MKRRIYVRMITIALVGVVAGLYVVVRACAMDAADQNPDLYVHKIYRDPSIAERSFKDGKAVALVVAAASGNIPRIDKLVADGANVNARGRYSMTPLFWAIQANSKSGFRRLLEKGADPNYVAGVEPLVADEDELETKEDPLALHPRSWCVLDLAAEDEHDSEWIELLLKHGANPNVVNPWGSRPKDIVHTAGWTPLFSAATRGTIKSMNLLIAAGAIVDHQDNCGNTPAILAANGGRYDFVYRLLKTGANHRIKNNSNEDVAYMLVDNSTRGEGVDPKSEDGRQLAQVFDLLEKRGVNIEAARKAVLEERQRLELIVKEREERIKRAEDK